ncbi:hypothetical protein QE152_g26550 [Popillia japonica]|uniref:Uncharacterized protein n=1 Tax=Popillia japonica TaxID=7064 RepID=A0AAW1JZ20_POPJA
MAGSLKPNRRSSLGQKSIPRTSRSEELQTYTEKKVYRNSNGGSSQGRGQGLEVEILEPLELKTHSQATGRMWKTSAIMLLFKQISKSNFKGPANQNQYWTIYDWTTDL